MRGARFIAEVPWQEYVGGQATVTFRNEWTTKTCQMDVPSIEVRKIHQNWYELYIPSTISVDITNPEHPVKDADPAIGTGGMLNFIDLLGNRRVQFGLQSGQLVVLLSPGDPALIDLKQYQ